MAGGLRPLAVLAIGLPQGPESPGTTPDILIRGSADLVVYQLED